AAAENDVDRIHNPILSDLAFANLPWRAAVREAFVNGRLPLWNRFVLGGNPLLGTAQSGVFHPSTWFGIFLPLALSWTFSCAFTIFLALVSGYLFFREFCRSDLGALTGAVGWGFSTYVLFWGGWAVGPSIATFPLLLLGLRRLARGGERGITLASTALILSVAGGHPETLFHSIAAGGVYFVSELFASDARRRAGRAIAGSLGAGLLAACLAAPVLLPLLEAVPHSAEYRERRAALAKGRSGQSVPADEAARRILPVVLPFAHGIYGKSPVQDVRQDGSGMPLAYAGAVLFPLAALGLLSRAVARSRWIFLVFILLGVAYGASAPLLLDLTSRLPGFALALNYRLVFLAPLGLAGLAALGADRLAESRQSLGVAATAVAAALMFAYVLAVPVFRERGLTAGFTRPSMAFEVVPVVLLLVASFSLRRRLAAAALLLLVGQRFFEMRGTYPTLPAGTLAPSLSIFSVLPRTADPYRIVAAGETFRPNAAALYGLEDVRGYESLVLDRFAETYPLWCRPQFASFNRVEDLDPPFLSFVNVRYAIAELTSAAPPGWVLVARTREGSVFENPRVQPRAFVPRRLRVQPDAKLRLAEMGSAPSLAEVAWLGRPPGEGVNGSAQLAVREIGTDLIVEADVRDRALVATSIPDWPGWGAKDGAADVPLVTVNHAFVGFWLAPGRHVVRLHYLPSSFLLGSLVAGGAVIAVSIAAVLRRRRGLR
ncbi:MAG TPA: YfhO family protein, partial [Thermoanaerobaculia bacterium]